MGDQPVTRAEFDGLIVSAKALLNQMATLTAKVDHMNNNRKKKQNMRCVPIRVPHGRNNRIIEDSSSSMMEKTDVGGFP